MAFSRRIRMAVARSGLSQAQICEATGIDKGHLSHFLAGHCWVSERNLNALAAVLMLKVTATGKPPAIPRRKPGRKPKDKRKGKGP